MPPSLADTFLHEVTISQLHLRDVLFRLCIVRCVSAVRLTPEALFPATSAAPQELDPERTHQHPGFTREFFRIRSSLPIA
jgi:hypothetical protein